MKTTDDYKHQYTTANTEQNRDMEQASEDYGKFSTPDIGKDDQDVFTRKPRCCQSKPSHDWLELLRKIEAKGTTGGDCGACPREDVALYMDLCHRCTLEEIWGAIDKSLVGPLLEKYEI